MNSRLLPIVPIFERYLLARTMAAVDDRGVVNKSNTLEGKSVLLGICGGIAATESVKIARELRRHGAKLSVIMTESSQKIITPLAIEWAADTIVMTDWNSNMSQLENHDAILICPATRNLLANHAHGIMSTPLLMALSSARGREVPIVFAPSMHADLFNDPITEKLQNELIRSGCEFIWGERDEGKRKQMNPVSLVAEFTHIVNKSASNPKKIVITLGATKGSLDSVRHIQNTSTGRTGWAIACELFRRGHDITVVSGETSASPEFGLPLIIKAPEPNEMLAELMALSKCEVDAWIHCAAVLDYVPKEPVKGKITSGSESLNVELVKTDKHIDILGEICEGAIRIGFKLEANIEAEDLIIRAKEQIERAKMNAVVANNLDYLSGDKIRGILVKSNGEEITLANLEVLVSELRKVIEE